jgi:hypothetical protein
MIKQTGASESDPELIFDKINGMNVSQSATNSH